MAINPLCDLFLYISAVTVFHSIISFMTLIAFSPSQLNIYILLSLILLHSLRFALYIIYYIYYKICFYMRMELLCSPHVSHLYSANAYLISLHFNALFTASSIYFHIFLGTLLQYLFLKSLQLSFNTSFTVIFSFIIISIFYQLSAICPII